jgi:hypothetical protein
LSKKSSRCAVKSYKQYQSQSKTMKHTTVTVFGQVLVRHWVVPPTGEVGTVISRTIMKLQTNTINNQQTNYQHAITHPDWEAGRIAEQETQDRCRACDKTIFPDRTLARHRQEFRRDQSLFSVAKLRLCPEEEAARLVRASTNRILARIEVKYLLVCVHLTTSLV